ncbi:MAG: hypothetical protein J07HB67_02714, partial [halophilic archaeon J07HB67]
RDGTRDREEATARSRVVVEAAGPLTALGTGRVGWLVEAARETHTTGETARLVVPASDQTPPTARLAAPARVRVDTTVELDAGNSTDTYGIVRYDWTGDGSFESNGATTRWTPETAGNQTVRVGVVDPAGNVARATATVTVESNDDTGTGGE